MATTLSSVAGSVYIGGPFEIEWFEAGDGNLKTSVIAMYDSGDVAEIKICSTSGIPAGVVGDMTEIGVDLITAQSAGKSVPLYLLGIGTKLRLPHDGDSTDDGVRGDRVVASAATAGHVKVFSYVTPDTTTYVGSATAFTERNQTRLYDVGRLIRDWDVSETEWGKVVT